jgi:O-methyltransferase
MGDDKLHFGQRRHRLLFRAGQYLARIFDFVLAPHFQQSMMDFPLFLAFDTAAGNDLEGDYYEFGVWKGRSFRLAYRRARLRLKAHQFNRMKFVAFDSFEGLPASNDPTLPAQYHSGAYSAPQALFERNILRAGLPADRLVIVKGWYDDLERTTAEIATLQNSKIAICYIDCDIYESTVPILDFILPRLQIGSLIVVDDWNRHLTSSKFGIRRAFREWQERNPKLVLTQITLTKRVLFAVDFLD